MWPYIVSLLWRSLGDTVAGAFSRTLVTVILVVLAFALNYLIQLRKERSSGDRIMVLIRRHLARAAVRPTLWVWAGLFTLAFLYFLARNVNNDHNSLIEANGHLTNVNAAQKKELERRKHSLITTDPVFPNTIYFLQAFNIFRHRLNGEPCVIKVTAPRESEPMASMVAQFSHSVSGCYTFGPMDSQIDPEVEKETTSGMVPDMIVFHADKDDAAANQLFIDLGNQIQLKRSYEPTRRNFQIPEHGRVHVVWLQFGTNVRWNSELRQ